ncbi:MAG: cobalamin-binding protein [Desulfobacteraceae bacterium]
MSKTLLIFTGYVWLLLSMIPAAAIAQRTVTDQMGRHITIPDDPKRVVALAPSLSEIVCALGKQAILKGVTQYSDYPAYVKTLPQVGSYIRPDLERILRLKPDLCLSVKDGNPKETIQRLSDMGIAVYVLDPHDLSSVIRAIDEVGGLLHAKARARKLTDDMKTRINHVRAFNRTLKHRPRVFFQIGVSPIVSAGKGSFLHELIELSGAVNLADGAVAYPRFSREQVLNLNPDILIITSMTRGLVFEDVKREWESWPDLSAVKKKRVYVLDSDILDRPTPRMVDGLEMLVKVIHPGFVLLKGCE